MSWVKARTQKIRRLFSKSTDQPVDKGRSPNRKILHISDLHVSCGETEARWLKASKAIAAKYSPDEWIIVATGDLVDHGKAGEYARLMDGFALLRGVGFEIYIVPGNHDYGPWGNVYSNSAHRRFLEFCQDFAGVHEFPARVDLDGFSILLLDSTAHGRQGEPFARGRIGARQISWLEAQLADDRPFWVALHHRPYWGHLFLSITDRKELTDLVERRTEKGQMIKYLCGHRHVVDLEIVAAGKFLDEQAIIEVNPITGDAKSCAL